MSTLIAPALLAVAVALPHRLELQRSTPSAAIAIWLAALVLRALVSVTAVLLIVIWLPATAVFQQLTGWCWHAVLPFVLAHLQLSGRRLGDFSTLVPALILTLSVSWVGWGVLKATRAVKRLLRAGGLGPGPGGSVLVGRPEVILAAAGLWRPRVVVSTGALAELDDSELAAGIAHEKGHIARSHRYLLLAGVICRGLARFLPGTQRALEELAFNIERDADEYALSERHDPLSLASAICKSAGSRIGPGLIALGAGPRVTGRVRILLAEEPDTEPQKRRRNGPRVLAVAMTSLTLAALIASPVVLVAQAQGSGHVPTAHCPS